MPLDTSKLWSHIEGTETVTYYVRTVTNAFADGKQVHNAKRRAASKNELQTSGLFGKVALTWHLWRVKLGGITPKPNDKIKDARGRYWSVKEVEVQSFGNRFRLTCIEER